MAAPQDTINAPERDAGSVTAPGGDDLSRILGIEVPVIVLLAQQQMSIESILQMTIGTIVEFEVPFDAELSLNVANHTIGRGQAVKVGENFGLRITRVNSVADRVDALGGG